jgi:hypothetical protein
LFFDKRFLPQAHNLTVEDDERPQNTVNGNSGWLVKRRKARAAVFISYDKLVKGGQ